MILADKILKLRKESGMSQEELAEKLNVSRQSVSKWESASAYPELDKILQLANLFGVTTDYLLKDDAMEAQSSSSTENRVTRVSLQEADSYLENRKICGRQAALAAALFTLCPVPIIALSGAVQAHMIPLSEDLAGGIGVILLLAIVVVACVVSSIAAAGAKRFDYLKGKDFELEYGVEGVLRQRQEACVRGQLITRAVAIALLILCSAPLILASILDAPDYAVIFFVVLLLAFVAASVFLLIDSDAVPKGCSFLLAEGDYAPSGRQNRNRARTFRRIFWPIVVAAYLGWSFLSRNWAITWVIWPVAALVARGVSAIWREPRHD